VTLAHFSRLEFLFGELYNRTLKGQKNIAYRVEPYRRCWLDHTSFSFIVHYGQNANFTLVADIIKCNRTKEHNCNRKKIFVSFLGLIRHYASDNIELPDCKAAIERLIPITDTIPNILKVTVSIF